jgi:SNF2 family DNA or RNA helicase
MLLLNDTLSSKQKEEALRKALRNPENLMVVVNYESAWREPLASLLLATRWTGIVADEMHRIKSAFGKASEFLAKLGPRAGWKIGLTGTPLPHSYIDIFAQYRFLDPSIFGPSYYAFEARYAVKGGFDGKQIVDWKNVGELQAKIHSIAYRVRAEDVLSLPPFRDVVLPVDLEPMAKRHYRQLETQFITEVGTGVVTVSNALVKLLRLQQLTGGWLTDEEGVEHHVSTAKQRALTDLLTDMAHDEPVVVFCRFHKDLDTVHHVSKALGRGSGELSGRRRELAEWQAGSFPILAVQWQAGGVGVDFTRSRYCVMYSTGFSGGDYEQGRKRIHRPGQDRPVVYYHLPATGTVDTVVYKALATKQDLAEAVLDYARHKKG